MDHQPYYEIFNCKAEEFFKDLVITFPEISDFKKFKAGFTFLRNFDPKCPSEYFRQFVSNKYKDAVMSKDETFFLQEQHFGILEHQKDYWVNCINQLKNIWTTMDPTNKDIIWKYFQIMIILSDKCQELV
jgi:hypothetical protein